MAFKDILVHIDVTEGQCHPLEAALLLAQQDASHVIGLAVSPSPISGFTAPEIYPEVYQMLQEIEDRTFRECKDLFLSRVAREQVSQEFREAEGDALSMIAMHARYADLVVVSQPDPDSALPSFVHELPIVSGCPVLVIPAFIQPSVIGSNITIAWNASREAARAVADAMPFLQRAKQVNILAVSASADTAEEDTLSAADLAIHLARHGVTAEAREAVASDIDVANLLLSYTADLGSDLLVMGAYGHSRLREIVLGGATRGILGSMTIPVLFSH